MTTIRNEATPPSRTRRIARVGQALGTAALAGGVALLTACTDTPTASPTPASGGPRLATTTTVGDTTYTTFRIDPNDNGTIVIVGGVHKLAVEKGAVCDPATSGYGPDLWDAPCAPATSGVDFSAKSWFDANGHPRIVITPDVRFVPGKVVTMYMKDKNAAVDATSNILYCAIAGAGCVDESKTDSSLAPTRDGNGGYVSRRVKHFSGYTVIVGADCPPDAETCGGEYSFDRAALSAPSFDKGGTAPGQGAGNGNGNGGSKPGQKTTGGTQDSVWLGTELATPVVATSLERKEALADTVSATFIVTKAGGVFTVPGTGLDIWVQANTVSGDFPLTVKALPGKVVAYEFGPSGTKFPKSLIMIQDLKGTNYDSRVGATFDAGYFSSLGDVDAVRGTALIKERLQNMFDAESGKFYFAVNHFSGYMVSWGCRDNDRY